MSLNSFNHLNYLNLVNYDNLPMIYKELKTKSEAEVSKMLEDLQHDLQVLSQKIKLNQDKQTHKVKAIKMDIARIKTYLSSK